MAKPVYRDLPHYLQGRTQKEIINEDDELIGICDLGDRLMLAMTVLGNISANAKAEVWG